MKRGMLVDTSGGIKIHDFDFWRAWSSPMNVALKNFTVMTELHSIPYFVASLAFSVHCIQSQEDISSGKV